ncbi:hypothetical protein DMP17_04435 [Pseudonocardia sp. TMWB2A]|uniref:TonB family protein n=1 Tax=Pseudonocardia sp. TMWB2A TaxID=687430 RepID=UPI00307D1572
MSILLMLAMQANTVDRSRSVEPITNPSEWVLTSDYPADALANNEEGTSQVTLAVNGEGKVESCSAKGESEALNMAACLLIRERARFKPALDKEGRPTNATFTRWIRWRIPQPQNGSAVDATQAGVSTKVTTLRLVIEKDGSVSDCRIAVTQDGKDMPAFNRCPSSFRERGTPMINAAGQRIRTEVEVRTNLTRKPLSEN